MWLAEVPGEAELLRQGDLIKGIPFPRAGSVSLTAEGLRAEVDLDVTAAVLDHCCTVQQKHVLVLARVKSQGTSERMLAGLNSVEPLPGRPYSRYTHLLQPHSEMPTKTGKVKVINLLDRVHLVSDGEDAFADFRRARVARMDAVARAHLRQKLVVLFGRVEEDEDLPALTALGLDVYGVPVPPVHHGFR